MKTPLEFRRKWASLFAKYRIHNKGVVLSRYSVEIFWKDFETMITDFYFEAEERAGRLASSLSKEEAMSRRIERASREWWEEKGAIPLSFFAKKYNVLKADLSLKIQDEIFEKAGVTKPPPQPTVFEMMYYEKYKASPDFHTF